jgi:hypothetical protein
MSQNISRQPVLRKMYKDIMNKNIKKSLKYGGEKI